MTPLYREGFGSNPRGENRYGAFPSGIGAAGDGAFMEPSGRNQWQQVANDSAQKTARIGRSATGRNPVSAGNSVWPVGAGAGRIVGCSSHASTGCLDTSSDWQSPSSPASKIASPAAYETASLSSRVKSWKYERSVTGAMLCPYSRTAERGHRIVAGLQLDRYLRQDSLATRIDSASPFSATSRGASSSTAPAVRAVSSLATISPAPAVAAMRAAVCTPSPR
jgi:hypothetical protein